MQERKYNEEHCGIAQHSNGWQYQYWFEREKRKRIKKETVTVQNKVNWNQFLFLFEGHQFLQ